MKKPVILLADDHPEFRESIADILGRTGKYEVVQAPNGIEALRIAEEQAIDCVLLDYHMPGMTGLEVAERLNISAPHIPIILMSSYGGKPQGWVQEKAVLVNVTYADKNAGEILRAVEKSVYVAPDIEVDDATKDHLRDLGFVFAGTAMNALVHRALLAAHSGLNVLITGETGAGKTQLARMIHAMGPRSDQPFISFACSNYAANQQLFTGQVFGHTKQAFTGATTEKKSLFEEAGSGTLFLDEISEIPLDAQATLLAALDQRTYQRLGEHVVRPIHCSIISATNRNLDEAVAERMFRKDLMLRLKQEYIAIPPLRERSDDIPDLVRLYLREYARMEHGRRLRIEPEAIAYLKRQQWPGNARQLRSVIHRVAHTTTSESITVADFYPVMKDETAPSLPLTRPATPPLPSPIQESDSHSLDIIIQECIQKIFDSKEPPHLNEVLEMFRRSCVEESLRRSHGNIKEAERKFWGYAETGKGALMHQIKKFGIDPKRFREK